MKYALLPAIACAMLVATPGFAQRAQTLRDVLGENHIATAAYRGPLDQPITSFAASDSSDVFVMAYYVLTPGIRALDDTLHVATFDKTKSAWQTASLSRQRPAATHDDPPLYLGSILDIHRSGSRFYVDTHMNPSAGVILVLSRDLKPVTTLFGWVLRVLPNGVVVYHRSAIHFAPTHAAEIWTYDPRTQRDALLYPQKPFGEVRAGYADHFDSALDDSVVANAAGSAIAFMMKYGDSEKNPVEAAILCRGIATVARHCSEYRLSGLMAQHPDWPKTQILSTLLAAR